MPTLDTVSRLVRKTLWPIPSSIVAATILAVAPAADAQVTNPTIVEFLPPPEHTQTLSNGQPAVTRYQLDFYFGSPDSALSLPIGKPAAQADGMIRLEFASLMTGWPVTGVVGDLRVTAIGPNGVGVSAPSNPLIATSSTTPSTRLLGNLVWTSMTNGWGPAERNRSNGEKGAADGATITLAGRSYTTGIGVHAPATLRYSLAGACSSFLADIGVDDEIPSGGSVRFEVWGDGVRLFRSSILTAGSATQAISVDTTGRQELTLIVTDGDDGTGKDHADWANARLTCPATGSVTSTAFISDGAWSTVTNGWGPAEKDRSNGEQLAGDGLPLTLAGRTYAKGLGVHAGSNIRYAVNAACTTFAADIGVDDEVGITGSVVFQVWADSVKLFDSGTMTGASATRSVVVDVAGRQELALVVTDAGNGNGGDHADWADARVTCATGGV
jgi:hypothetical protein